MMTDTKKETPSTPTKAPDEVIVKKGKPFSLKFYHGNLDLSREDFEKLYGPPEKTCAKCEKIFVPAPYHRYKDSKSNYYCSWTCYLHRDDGKKIANGKPVEQYTREGAYLAIFPSAVEAAKYVGLKKADGIRDCCNGKTKSSAGFVWRYKEEKND